MNLYRMRNKKKEPDGSYSFAPLFKYIEAARFLEMEPKFSAEYGEEAQAATPSPRRAARATGPEAEAATPSPRPAARATPSPRRAALMLADAGVLDLAGAWALISSGPARVLGLTDRGELSPGKRADFVVLDAQTRRVAATFVQGRVSYMSGAIAERFVG